MQPCRTTKGGTLARWERFLERADQTTRLLDVKYFMPLSEAEAVGSTLDQLGWMALLKSASAYEMYRKRSQRITPTGVTNFGVGPGVSALNSVLPAAS